MGGSPNVETSTTSAYWKRKKKKKTCTDKAGVSKGLTPGKQQTHQKRTQTTTTEEEIEGIL